MQTTTLDPERQRQAKRYARIRRRLFVLDIAFGAVYILLWLLLGWSLHLREWITTFTTNDWLVIALYVLVFGGIYSIATLPLAYYSEFVLPHRFGQSNQSLKDWIVDQIKSLSISAPIGLVMLELLYLALRFTGDAWWLWATGGMLLFSVLLSNLAPILIMPLFNKYIPLGDEHKDLENRLLDLAKRANTHVRGVFKFDMSRRTKSANAALTGIGNTRRIILGDTLINEFTPDEIETVLAHELGHHVNKDIPFFIISSTLLSTLSFYIASLVLNWAVGFFSFNSVADIAAFPALTLIIGANGMLILPLQNALSRWRESLADDYALKSTGKGEAFASAFTRLANQNLSDIDPERWAVFMFYSHPPLKDRIAKAKQYNPA